MDGGANICITDNLSTMVGVINIPPIAISVALAGSIVLEDNFCMKRGYIPLICLDGTIYWQLCFFCANVVKTIILPQAV
jgi:hypothetical protein